MAPSLNADKDTPSSCGLAPALFFLDAAFPGGHHPKDGNWPQSPDSTQDLRPAVVEKMVRPRFNSRIGSCSPAKKA